MDTTTTTSILAIIISAFSAALAVFNYVRDRPRIIAWSEIIYDRSKDLENPPPCFYLKIVNAGRRPIVITEIEKKWKKGTWTNPLVEINVEAQSDDNVSEHALKKAQSTEHTSKVLKESDFFEASYEGHDFLGEICGNFGDELLKAESLSVLDIFGRRYPVKNSKKHIAEMLKNM